MHKIRFVIMCTILLSLWACDNSASSEDALNVSSSGTAGFSREALSSSSQASVPSSSSVAIVSSSSCGPQYVYTDWASCEIDGMCGTFEDNRQTPAKSYKWTKIGNQVWMAENLAYLPSVNDLEDASSTDPVYYVYGYDGTDVDSAKAYHDSTVAYYQDFGVLYNWAAALKACPSGWHLPSSNEWDNLTAYVGDGFSAGGRLRSSSGWTSEIGATHENAYGFSLLPGGECVGEGICRWMWSSGYWWSATPYDSLRANLSEVQYYKNNMAIVHYEKSGGLSVRCVKN